TSMKNGSGHPRQLTAIYGTRLNELDTIRRTLKSKTTSSLATRNIIANTYGLKASTIAGTSNLNKETKITETNTNNMELLPVEENLLLNQDKTDDNESVNSEDSFLSEHEEWRKKINLQKYKEDMEKACKIEIEGIQLNDRSTLTRAAINQNKKINNEKGINMSTRGLWLSAIVQFKKEDIAENLLMEWFQIIEKKLCRVTSPTSQELYNIISLFSTKTCYFSRNLYGKKKRMIIVSFKSQEGKDQVINFEWIAGEYRIKIVDTILKTCHRCHVKDHFVNSCPVAKKQREISERKARNFEKYRQLYKRQRSQLYKSLMGGINMGTSYLDAEQVKDIDERLELVEIHSLLEENKTTLARLNEVEKYIEKNNEQGEDKTLI
ncbi:3790_t:CDS:2, partial [Diversispora eburnea]